MNEEYWLSKILGNGSFGYSIAYQSDEFILYEYDKLNELNNIVAHGKTLQELLIAYKKFNRKKKRK